MRDHILAQHFPRKPHVRSYRLLLDALVGDRLLQCVHLDTEGIMERAEPQLGSRAKLPTSLLEKLL